MLSILRVLFIGLVFISRDRAQKIVEVTLNFPVSPVMARAFPLMAREAARDLFHCLLFVHQVLLSFLALSTVVEINSFA